MIPYTCPGPLRTFATVLAVTVGVHAWATVVGLGVSDGMVVAVNVGVAVSVTPIGTSVGGAPPGKLQASIATVMKKTDNKIFLFFASIVFSSERINFHIIGGICGNSTPPFLPFCDQHFCPHANTCICVSYCPQ